MTIKRLGSVSIQAVHVRWDLEAEPVLTLSMVAATMTGASSLFHDFGKIFAIEVKQPNIYSMAGGGGDSQVQGGDRSQLIMKIILQLGVTWRRHIEKH